MNAVWVEYFWKCLDCLIYCHISIRSMLYHSPLRRLVKWRFVQTCTRSRRSLWCCVCALFASLTISYQPVLFVGRESSLISPSTNSARKHVSHRNNEKGNLNCFCIRNAINVVFHEIVKCFAIQLSFKWYTAAFIAIAKWKAKLAKDFHQGYVNNLMILKSNHTRTTKRRRR